MKASLYIGLILLPLLVGCSQKKSYPMPTAERSPTDFFTDEIDKALHELHALEGGLDAEERAHVQTHIQNLQTRLARLRFYYLPLMHVRELAYSAYRFYHIDRRREAYLQLQEAQHLLEAVAAEGDTALKAEIEKLINRVFHVEEAFRIHPELVQERFEALIHGLNLKAIEGSVGLSGPHVFPGNSP